MQFVLLRYNFLLFWMSPGQYLKYVISYWTSSLLFLNTLSHNTLWISHSQIHTHTYIYLTDGWLCKTTARALRVGRIGLICVICVCGLSCRPRVTMEYVSSHRKYFCWLLFFAGGGGEGTRSGRTFRECRTRAEIISPKNRKLLTRRAHRLREFIARGARRPFFLNYLCWVVEDHRLLTPFCWTMGAGALLTPLCGSVIISSVLDCGESLRHLCAGQ